MKKTLPLLALLCAACITQASAVEYSFAPPEGYLFAKPTSQEIIYEQASENIDRSKDVALVPPGFGTPTSYLPGSGELLTPNLVPGALTGGGLVSFVASVTYPSVQAGNSIVAQTASYTAVSGDLYYSGGYLATLKISKLGVNAKVYEGTDSTQLAKGVGHFSDTSIWDGNVCLAGHNRGANGIFGEIHTLRSGDTITLTTLLGSRTYKVSSVSKVKETDNSGTVATAENQLTLYTCVRDQRDYRWCVVAKEV